MSSGGHPSGHADDLSTRLRLLEDERDIRTTLYQYGHALDYGAEADWVDCFVPGARYEVRMSAAAVPGESARVYEGCDELAAFAARHTRAPGRFHKHIVVDPIIRVDGTTATAVSYFLRLDDAGGERIVYAFGRYRDELVRCADGRWRFAVRVAEVESRRTNPAPRRSPSPVSDLTAGRKLPAIVDGGSAGRIATDFGLGSIDQISFAVTSVERALAAYEALFGGRFEVRDVTLTPESVSYRGVPAEIRLRLAFGKTAGLQIELVEVLSGPAPSLEHLRRHGEGLHHVRFPVDDIAAKTMEMECAGFEVIFGGTTPRGSRFAYLEAPAKFGHSVIELIQHVPTRPKMPEQTGPSAGGR